MKQGKSTASNNFFYVFMGTVCTQLQMDKMGGSFRQSFLTRLCGSKVDFEKERLTENSASALQMYVFFIANYTFRYIIYRHKRCDYMYSLLKTLQPPPPLDMREDDISIVLNL